jgi:hypothetical protein
MLKLQSIKTGEFAWFVDAHLDVNIPTEEAIRQQQMKRAITLIEQRPPIEPNSQRAWSKAFRGNHQTWPRVVVSQARPQARRVQTRCPPSCFMPTQLPEVIALRLAGASPASRRRILLWDLCLDTALARSPAHSPSLGQVDTASNLPGLHRLEFEIL